MENIDLKRFMFVNE